MTENHDLLRIGPYHRLDIVSDPGVVILRRLDGSEVTKFSRSGATRETIQRAASEDREQLRK